MKKKMFVHFVGVHAIQKGGSTVHFIKIWEAIHNACPISTELTRATFTFEDDKVFEQKADVVILHATGNATVDREKIFPTWRQLLLWENCTTILIFEHTTDQKQNEDMNVEINKFLRKTGPKSGASYSIFAYQSPDDLEKKINEMLKVEQMKLLGESASPVRSS